MNASRAGQQAKNSAVLVAPILERALHDRTTRRALRGVVARAVSRRTSARVVHQVANAASPVAAWIKSVEREQRRRDRRRWLLGALGAVGALAAVIAVRMGDRSRGNGTDDGRVNADPGDRVVA
ncbi:MAG: hypothetical protein HYX33_02645 [Actinobacteria bacterium]|nr:hypothetical protein [Actinomycetota bacterium]